MKRKQLLEQKTNNETKKRRILAITGCFLLVLALVTGVTMAKYVQKWKSSPAMADAQAFYFTSDLLKPESENAIYYIDPLASSFSFQLMNSADAQRFSEVDIPFKVEVTGGTADANTLTGTLAQGKVNVQTLSVSPVSGAKEVAVTATAAAPYKKALKATFLLAKGNECTVEDSSGNTAAVLIMTCKDDGKDITIQLPEGVIPDATDSRVVKKEGNTYFFQSPGKGVYSLVLLKTEHDIKLKSESNFADSITVTKV